MNDCPVNGGSCGQACSIFWNQLNLGMVSSTVKRLQNEYNQIKIWMSDSNFPNILTKSVKNFSFDNDTLNIIINIQ